MAERRRKYTGNRRYGLLDTIRGITLCSMIGYHLSWDLVYLLGISWPWYHSSGAFYWQQDLYPAFRFLHSALAPQDPEGDCRLFMRGSRYRGDPCLCL